MTAAEEARPFAGRVALVTGGAGGLGTAVSMMLARNGARVVVADVRGDAAHSLVESAAASDLDMRAAALDLSDELQVEQVVDDTIRDFGSPDILVNNAGIDVTAPVGDISIDDWDRIMAVNLRGPFLMSRLAFPRMKQQDSGGQLVNIVSTAAKRAWPNASAYHASKWGLLGFSHALHAEGKSAGIKVTAVINGGMRTPFLLDRFPDIDQSVLQDPSAVAETVRFVLSQPANVTVPEIMVLPTGETSWP